MQLLLILILFLVLIAVQIVLLIRSVCKKEKKYWICLFSVEILSIIISVMLMIYYDSLHGIGFMPGLTYFEHWFLSFGTAIISTVILVLSLIIGIIAKLSLKQKKD